MTTKRHTTLPVPANRYLLIGVIALAVLLTIANTLLPEVHILMFENAPGWVIDYVGFIYGKSFWVAMLVIYAAWLAIAYYLRESLRTVLPSLNRLATLNLILAQGMALLVPVVFAIPEDALLSGAMATIQTVLNFLMLAIEPVQVVVLCLLGIKLNRVADGQLRVYSRVLMVVPVLVYLARMAAGIGGEFSPFLGYCVFLVMFLNLLLLLCPLTVFRNVQPNEVQPQCDRRWLAAVLGTIFLSVIVSIITTKCIDDGSIEGEEFLEVLPAEGKSPIEAPVTVGGNTSHVESGSEGSLVEEEFSEEEWEEIEDIPL